ncbi:hypothetical protein HDU96_007525 [Phlyctochytrium bullatum]|nr:hypothetical protein HDU96_007525 [Phlyctochytrium bullatum]
MDAFRAVRTAGAEAAEAVMPRSPLQTSHPSTPTSAKNNDPSRRKSFWASFTGLSLYIILCRIPLMTFLAAVVGITHSNFWREKTHRYDLVFMQQIVTGIIGLIVALMMRDTAWMAQGAVAAAWSFRKRGVSLVTAEAIQGGYPGLVFKTSSHITDKLW